jgi:hypothetical protein
MNPNDIKLNNLSKSFEYTKACMEIDSIEDVEDIKDIAKAYMKLYLKQQEVLSDILKSDKI